MEKSFPDEETNNQQVIVTDNHQHLCERSDWIMDRPRPFSPMSQTIDEHQNIFQENIMNHSRSPSPMSQTSTNSFDDGEVFSVLRGNFHQNDARSRLKQEEISAWECLLRRLSGNRL